MDGISTMDSVYDLFYFEHNKTFKIFLKTKLLPIEEVMGHRPE